MALTPYLIQRGTINTPFVEDRLSRSVSLDYMGSAEFEFGALPESLQALRAEADCISVTVEPRITGDNGASLRVLHVFGPEEYEEYVGYLLKLREGSLQTKEHTYFDLPHLKSKHFTILRCDFWWDVGNHVMWSFNKNFMKRLPDVLAASWKYMDEQKKK
jgi:hypothetical protein